MVNGHLLVRADEVVLRDAWPALAQGLRRADLLGGTVGTVHSGLGIAQLAADGHIDVHVHSHEEAFYVLEGEPVSAQAREIHPLLPVDRHPRTA